MEIRPSTALLWVRRIAIAAAFGLLGFIAGTFGAIYLQALADEQQWFAHPSQLLADAVSMAVSILESAWLHWIGGIILGFAGGVWLDYWLRSRPERPRAAPPEPVKGLLDYQRDMDRSGKKFGALIVAGTREMATLGRAIQKATTDSIAVKEAVDLSIGATPRQTARFEAATNRLAKEFDVFARRMAAINADSKPEVTIMNDAVRWFGRFQPTSPHVRAAVTVLHARSKETVAKASEFMQSMAGTRWISAVLTAAIDNAMEAQDAYIAQMQSIEFTCRHLTTLYAVQDADAKAGGALSLQSPSDTEPETRL